MMNQQATRYGMSQEEKDNLYKSLTEKFGYDKVKFDKPVEEAEASASNKRFMGSIIDGIAQIGTANAVARGGKGYDGSAGRILNQAADTSVAEAANKRKAMIEDYLTKKNLGDSVEEQSRGMAKDQIAKERYDAEMARRDEDRAYNRERDRVNDANWNKSFGLKVKEAEKLENEPKLTEGQKAVDRDFAKDYNEWTSGGSKVARNEIDKLKNVVGRMKKGEVTTGGITGMFPDRMTTDATLSARSDVQSTVMNSLKALLGAQFTEKEGERIIRNTWNEGDSTENNMKRVERLIQDLESKAADKDSKVRFYEQTGTLSGYQPSESKPEKTIAKKQYSQKANKTKIIYSDGSEEIVDGRQ